MTHRFVQIALLGTVLGGCSLAGALLGLSEVLLLGIMPDADFAQEGADGYGKARLSLGGEDDGGSPLAPVLTWLEITSDDGSEVIVEDDTEHPGHAEGSFVLLVDGSGSMEAPSTECDYCPADGNRDRVEAARQLATELHACAPDWRISLMEFSSYVSAGELNKTRILADFTTETEAIVGAAELLSSDGGTPIWDSGSAVLSHLTDDADQYEALSAASGDTGDTGAGEEDSGGYGRGLVILTDGEDTDSSSSLDSLISTAKAAGVPVHVVGLGMASDLSDYSAGSRAVEDLQRLASETGGYYGAVYSASDLPSLASNIARAHCGGYTDLTLRWTEPAPSGELVSGTVSVAGTGVGVPFSFRAP